MLKNTGIVRRVDDLGRIILPKEIRRQTGIAPEDPVEFYVDHEQNFVAIRLFKPADNVKHELDLFKQYVSEQPEFRAQKDLLEKIREMENLLQKEVSTDGKD